MVEITLVLIGGFSLSNIFLLCYLQKYSIAHIFYFFIFIFFSLSPLLNTYADSFLLLDFTHNRTLFLKANILILIWVLCFSFFYYLSYIRTNSHLFNVCFRTPTTFSLVFLLTLIFLFYILTTPPLSIKSLVVRRFGFGSEHTSLNILYSYFFRPFTVFIAIYLYLLLNKLNKFNQLLALLIISIVFLYNFPTSYARFLAFTYLMVFIVFFLIKFKTGFLFQLALFLSIIGSELLNQFRYLYQNFKFDVSLRYLTTGHFDAYENFIWLLKYLEFNSLSYGKHMLGAFLFFIPRNYWETKPVGTGYYVYSMFVQNHFEQTLNKNVVMPLLAEWYFAFGIVGVVFSAVFYGTFIAKIDKLYLSNASTNKSLLVIYALLISLFLFHLRGDFLSSSVYIFLILLASYSAKTILGIKHTKH